MRAILLASALLASACSTTAPDAPPQSADATITSDQVLPPNVTLRPATWYSEQVKVSGRLFQPVGGNQKRAAVVLAPAEGQTAGTLDAYAIALGQQGIVALIVDYRGWGASGGQIYLGERVDVYDKMRFSEQTPELVIRRGRIDPEQQVQDLRNAITFLQSVDQVDGARIGVVGIGLGGGHVVSVLGMDARVKTGVAVAPVIGGYGEDEKSFAPDATTQAAMIKLAREGAPPRTSGEARERNALENRMMLAEYKPFWRLDAIPETSSVRFVVPTNDAAVTAAVGATKAKTDVQVAGADRGPQLAADWIAAQLGGR